MANLGNEVSEYDEPLNQIRIERERTALFRDRLSTPFQALLKHGFLSGADTIFDYGCGRGDDLRLLEAGGIEARGWDPHYAAEEPIVPADVVNLGFVINVIDNPAERIETLRKAFSLTRRVLAVSAMLRGQGQYDQASAHGDGVLTARNTFQKYYTQAELRELLEKALGRQPIAVRPGCFFVFKNDSDEQEFLEVRQHHRIEHHELMKWSLPGDRDERIYQRNKDLLDAFWETCLDLGRPPAPDEFSRIEDLRAAIGGPRRALTILSTKDRVDALERAAAQRRDDLIVFFGLNAFEHRRSAVASTRRIDRDIKAFMGSRRQAQEDAMEVLLTVGQPDVVQESCEAAHDAQLGWFEPPRFFFFESDRLNSLPVPLRLYVGCAAQLYGGLDDMDLLKAHINTAKLTAMRFDDYHGKRIPLLLERIKINMRSFDVDFFQYGNDQFETQPLYFKSRYMSPQDEQYETQCLFDKNIAALPGFDEFGPYGPPLPVLTQMLKEAGYKPEDVRPRTA